MKDEKALFGIGDIFVVHLDYYDEDEYSLHKINKIDTSFEEADEIVYWSDDSVYITESQLEEDITNGFYNLGVFSKAKLKYDFLVNNSNK